MYLYFPEMYSAQNDKYRVWIERFSNLFVCKIIFEHFVNTLMFKNGHNTLLIEKPKPDSEKTYTQYKLSSTIEREAMMNFVEIAHVKCFTTLFNEIINNYNDLQFLIL